MFKKRTRAFALLMALALFFAAIPVDAKGTGLENVAETEVTGGDESGELFDAASAEEEPTAEEETPADKEDASGEDEKKDASSEEEDAGEDNSREEDPIYTVRVPGTLTLTGKTGTNHAWGSSNPAVADIGGLDDNSATVDAKSEGTVTITHNYRVDGETYTETFTVNVKPATNHFKLTEDSSNITLYYTTGADAALQEVGKTEVTTTEPNIYFYVAVKPGYGTTTEFADYVTVHDPARETFPTTSGNSQYHNIDDNTVNPNPPGVEAAKTIGCSYKFQYTGCTVAKGRDNMWAQFTITGKPVETTILYSAGEVTSASGIPTDNKTYYHSNVTEVSGAAISFTIPAAAPSDATHTFEYWQGSDGKRYYPGQTVQIKNIWNNVTQTSATTGTFTLTAVWDGKVSISYDPNCTQTGIDTVVDNRLYDKGDAAIVKENKFRLVNYTFIGWNTESNGSGTWYDAGDSITLNDNTTLYAQWQSKAGVTIHYSAVGLGGTVDRASEIVQPEEGTILGSTASVTNSDYYFVGWSTDASGTTILSAEENYVPSREDSTWTGRDIWYFAIFKQKQQIQIGENGGNNGDNGNTGDTGNNGDDGNTGDNDNNDDDGNTGDNGNNGDDGNTDDNTGNNSGNGGNAGNNGNNGSAGNNGGNAGNNGNGGNNGNNGNAGNNGGNNGNNGNVGNNGNGVNIANNGGNGVNIANNNGNGGVAIIEDEDTPAAENSSDDDNSTTIVDEDVPLAPAGSQAKWALINLIAAILTVLTSIVLLITLFIGKKKEDDDEEDEDDENETKLKRRTAVRIGSLIPAIVSAIVFFVTENMRNPMTLIDQWTLLMLVILVIELLFAFFSKKKTDDRDDDEDM